MLQEFGDWFKLILLWFATIGGWVFGDFFLGRLALIATLALTFLKIYRELKALGWEREHGYGHRHHKRKKPRGPIGDDLEEVE